MTELLYQTDSYLREFDAAVAAVEGNAVALDRTAFYPGGGGQPNDVGLLRVQGGEWRVVKVRKSGDNAWHEVEGTPPAVGTLSANRPRSFVTAGSPVLMGTISTPSRGLPVSSSTTHPAITEAFGSQARPKASGRVSGGGLTGSSSRMFSGVSPSSAVARAASSR